MSKMNKRKEWKIFQGCFETKRKKKTSRDWVSKVVEKCLKKCLINSETFLKMIRIYLNNTLTASVIDVVITICTTNIKFKADVTII